MQIFLKQLYPTIKIVQKAHLFIHRFYFQIILYMTAIHGIRNNNINYLLRQLRT